MLVRIKRYFDQKYKKVFLAYHFLKERIFNPSFLVFEPEKRESGVIFTAGIIAGIIGLVLVGGAMVVKFVNEKVEELYVAVLVGFSSLVLVICQEIARLSSNMFTEVVNTIL